MIRQETCGVGNILYSSQAFNDFSETVFLREFGCLALEAYSLHATEEGAKKYVPRSFRWVSKSEPKKVFVQKSTLQKINSSRREAIFMTDRS